MRYTSNGTAAVLAICLVGFQSAPVFAQSAVINDENDARSFAIREAEIARKKATGKSETETVETEVRVASDAAAGSDKITKAEKPMTRAAKALASPAGSEGLKAVIARHAAANGVPFTLADAIVRIESRYNPRASHAGNYGLMQIRHQTARGVGYTGGPSGLLDAETNARFGMKYLAQAYKLAGGDTCRTVMKYQSGHMATRMSGANRTYCAKVRTITAQS